MKFRFLFTAQVALVASNLWRRVAAVSLRLRRNQVLPMAIVTPHAQNALDCLEFRIFLALSSSLNFPLSANAAICGKL